MEADGFTLVKGKGKQRRWKACRREQRDRQNVYTEGDRDSIRRRLEQCRSELLSDEYWDIFRGCIQTAMLSNGNGTPQNNDHEHSSSQSDNTKPGPQIFEELICYGIGSFGSCLIAKYQLALFLILRDELEIGSSQCKVYDPILTEIEKGILVDLGCTVLEENEEGKRKVEDDCLFYMPHCGKALYNNLLWANWNPDRLQRMTIIGNSFNNMYSNTPERTLNSQAGYIVKILPYTQEVPVQNSFCYPDIFNDTSVHFFPGKRLAMFPAELWEEHSEPVYGLDVEIVQSTKNDLL